MTTTLVRVGEVAEQIRGVTFAKAEAQPALADGLVPVLTASNVTEHGLVLDSVLHVPKSKISHRQFLQRHDIVITASSGSLSVVGRAAMVSSDIHATFGAFCKVLRPSASVDPNYFAQFFKTREYRTRVSQLAAGANINNLRNEDLDGLQIPLPPLPEQRRIAAILDQADELRAKRRRALALLDELADALFVSMFPFDGSVPVRAIGETVSTTSGGTPSRADNENFGDDIPWVKSGEVAQGVVRATEEHLSEKGLRGSSAKLMPVGTVIVAMYGATAGEVGELAIPAATNQAVCCINPEPVYTTQFLVAALRARRAELKRMAVGGAQPNLSQGQIRALQLPVPSIQLQRGFSSLTNQNDRIRRQHSAHLAHLDELFATLQHRAFEGKL